MKVLIAGAEATASHEVLAFVERLLRPDDEVIVDQAPCSVLLVG